MKMLKWYFWSKMQAAQAENRWMEVPTGGEVYPEIQSTLFTDQFVVGEDGQDFDTVVSIIVEITWTLSLF